MEDIAPLINGSEKLTRVFGYWPSFHDAEILELHFFRGDVRPDEGIYKFPLLKLKIHTWELTNEINPQGYLVRRHHTITTIDFCDVSGFQMEVFNHQNAVFALSITSQHRLEGPSPYFAVEVEPAFGMGASFKCLRIEVIDAVPCTEDGKLVSQTGS